MQWVCVWIWQITGIVQQISIANWRSRFWTFNLRFLLYCIKFWNICLLLPSYILNKWWTHQSAIFYYVSVINYFMSFFAMSVSSSLVNEASKQIVTRVRSLKSLNLISAISLHRFHFIAEKEINLTIWKIVPIKRNFFINMIGVIFIYALWLDSLNRWWRVFV